MDIDRFKKTAESVKATNERLKNQTEYNKQFTIAYYNNITKHFLDILPTFVDKISFEDLDNYIDYCIEKNPYVDEYCFIQQIYSPRIDRDKVIYTTSNDYGNLWHLKDEIYKMDSETIAILNQNAKYVSDYRNGLWLESNILEKYIKEYIIDKLKDKLTKYGAIITNINLSIEKVGKEDRYGGKFILTVSIKNPLK